MTTKCVVRVFEHSELICGDALKSWQIVWHKGPLDDSRRRDLCNKIIAALKKRYDDFARISQRERHQLWRKCDETSAGALRCPFYELTCHRGKDGIKFEHYVGQLSFDGYQVEVLPKADRKEADENEADRWQSHLLDMLCVACDLPLQATGQSRQTHRGSVVLDFFLNRFLHEVAKLLRRGLVKRYRKVARNRTALKGRLLFARQISRNMVHRERFFTESDEYDYEGVLNRILCSALKLTGEIAVSGDIRTRARGLAFDFPEVSDIAVDEATFSRITYDRKTVDYRFGISLAKIILLHAIPTLRSGREELIAMMFDMNRLWEVFVAKLAKKFAMTTPETNTITIDSQKTKLFWIKDGRQKKGKTIRPDIVIGNGKETLAVWDTKWKTPDDIASDADLKQMFVYHLYWNTNKTALLYPNDGRREDISGSFVDIPILVDKNSEPRKHECSMRFLEIDDESAESSFGKRWVDGRMKAWFGQGGFP